MFRCSFCSKTEAEVAKLISGRAGFICDECVRVCAGLIAEDRTAEPSPPPIGDVSPSDADRTAYCAFCGRPIAWDDALLVPEQGVYCPECVADEAKPRA